MYDLKAHQDFGQQQVANLTVTPYRALFGMPQPVDCNWYGGGFFDVQQDL